MKKLFVSLLFLLLNESLPGQSIHSPIGAGYPGLGAYSLNHADAYSISSNIASLASIKQSTLAVYGENRFLLKETNYYSGVLIIPTLQGNFAIDADYFGFKNYNESQVGIAFGKQLGDKIAVSTKFNFYNFRIPQYVNAATIDAEAGIIIHVNEKIHVGFDLYNPAGGSFGRQINERLSSIYKVGIGYESSDQFLLTAELFREENQEVSGNIGFQYNFMKQFFMRGGMQTLTTTTFAGAGLAWKNFRLDVSVSLTPGLGISPGFMLIIKSIQKEM